MKPFKTLDEQLILLKSRGLIIEDTQKAKEYLLQYSYYNIINVYSKFFQHSPDEYIIDASFDEIRAVHIFDTEMKSIFFKYLIECEKHFKSIVCYRFSEHYRDIPFAYLRTSSYRNENLIDLSTTIALLSKAITTNVRTKKNNAIKHYNNNHKDVPLWVLINHLTFGQVVHMYTNFTNKLKNNIVKDVASYLEKNLDTKIIIEPQELETFLFNLIDLRNCVAHNNMLFHFKCKRNLTYIEQLHTPFSITRNQPKQDPFNCLIMMQALLQKEQYAIFHNTVLKRTRNLNVKLTSIPIDTILCSLGFLQSWYQSTSRLTQGGLSK